MQGKRDLLAQRLRCEIEARGLFAPAPWRYARAWRFLLYGAVAFTAAACLLA